MTIAEMLQLKPGDSFECRGRTYTVESVRIVPQSRESTDDNGKPITLDLSYMELIHNYGAIYAGPPIRHTLELPEFRSLPLF